MRSKSLFVTIILLAIILLSTACGGGGAERISSDNAAAVEKTQAPTPTPSPAGDATAGQEKFVATCSACHGPAGEGVEGLGKDMTTSEFIAGKTDTELVDFIKIGRDPSDPLNTTGVAMPPKGGNPALSESDLFDIVAYIRTIHK